jgi:hypothetical protein
MKSGLLSGLCFLLILLLAGCAALSDRGKPAGTSMVLEPQSIVKFSDLPVPAGLKLQTRDSYSFESSGVRVAVLKYEGKIGPDLIENFYKDQMPMYNWSLLNTVEYGDRLMNFERENETCIITLTPKGNNTIITISIGPKAQAPLRKPKQPIK